MRHGRTIGLIVTLGAVMVLIASLVHGCVGNRGRAVDSAVQEPPAERVRVQVLNATRIPGLAREATEQLRSAGFDVLHFGNAEGFAPDSSVVLDRVGREEVAQRVAEAVQIGRVESRPDTSLYLEATVVIGRDWPRIPAADLAEPEG